MCVQGKKRQHEEKTFCNFLCRSVRNRPTCFFARKRRMERRENKRVIVTTYRVTGPTGSYHIDT